MLSLKDLKTWSARNKQESDRRRVNEELRMGIGKESREPLTEGLKAKISCP